MTNIAEATTQDGFTADRDLVAYLVLRNGRVSQYELRHRHGIKNPAQAINDAEQMYHFEMDTEPALPNGDIPYVLAAGSVPAIAGTMPMFTSQQIEDADSPAFVSALDLWFCRGCRRHPVYAPTPDGKGGFQGSCPRHGPMMFDQL